MYLQLMKDISFIWKCVVTLIIMEGFLWPKNLDLRPDPRRLTNTSKDGELKARNIGFSSRNLESPNRGDSKFLDEILDLSTSTP